ncbi:MAG: glycerate kinase [Syntrophaceae bacterium]
MNPAEDLKEIFLKALERVDPYRMITGNIRTTGDMLSITQEESTLTEDLSRYDELLVLGIGKAAVKMARAIEEILGDRITRGSVITKYGHAEKLRKIHVLEASHPIPDRNSINGAQELYRLAHDADEKTLIINLVSGGGSALFTLPQEGISLEDTREVTKILLDCGADIKEINCIRKHLSRVKGGHFARISHPARMINLILSDVVGDRLDTIASGITVADNTTFAQARDILRKYHLEDRVPASITGLIQSGVDGNIPDTPKEGDPVFGNVVNVLLGNNLSACRSARRRGEELGYHAHVLTSSLTGEAREIAKFFTSIARDLEKGISEFKKPALIITGGETTVTIRGKGKGGRNQEMALAFLADLVDGSVDLGSISFLSAGTDGNDGPTDAAGAFVSSGIKENMERLGLKADDFLGNNDSYHFFEATDHLFKTGPTGTNVCDIQLLIVV